MASPTYQAQSLNLSTEIIDLIITYLLPFPPFNPVALPASDPLTKTLLSLTRCRASYNIASKYLYKYCVYIDSLEKVHKLARTLASRKERGEENMHQITSLYLTISDDVDNSGPNSISYQATDLSDHDLTAVTSLLNLLSPSLTRLILQMPSGLTQSQRRLSGQSDWTRATIHSKPTGPNALDRAYFSAFQSLINLEVLVNLTDNFHDLCYPKSIWLFFPKLRVLGMYELPYDHPADLLCLELVAMKRLDTVIMINEDFERSFEKLWEREAEKGRMLNVVLVQTAFRSEDIHLYSKWDRVMVGEFWTMNDKLRIRNIEIPHHQEPGDSKFTFPLEWVKSRLLLGEEILTKEKSKVVYGILSIR